MRLSGVHLVRGSVCRMFVLSLALASVLGSAPSAPGQAFRVIHSFTGSADGSTPNSTMVMDQAGNLYGTTSYGGAQPGSAGSGIVFKLVQRNSAWILTPLYTFQGGSDGAYPGASVVIGTSGILYGTTSLGGNPGCAAGMGCGTVYQLQPQSRACHSVLCPWTKTVLYRFTGEQDGANPAYGQLAFDHSGNIYGTTGGGGNNGSGVVYQLTHSSGGWQESVLHSFDGMGDGLEPQSGVVFDSQGNLYGTTVRGGAPGNGTVYELSPSESECGNLEAIRYRERRQLSLRWRNPRSAWKRVRGDIVRRPGQRRQYVQLATSGGQWNSTIIGSFTPLGGEGLGAFSSLTMDASAGNLYGTTGTDGAHGFRSVFELAPQNGSWVQTTLYDFAGGNDGCNPSGGVTVAPDGHLYGTTQGCGSGYGVVWEITP